MVSAPGGGLFSVEVPLTQGAVAWIDVADAPSVLARKWHLSARTKNGRYAVTSNGPGEKPTLLHVLLMGERDGFTVDHKDCDGLNNRRENLRWATAGQQAANRRNIPTGGSGYRGVTLHRATGRWQASLVFRGQKIALGNFDSALAAALARDAEAKKLWGEFAVLNFPGGIDPAGLNAGDLSKLKSNARRRLLRSVRAS